MTPAQDKASTSQSPAVPPPAAHHTGRPTSDTEIAQDIPYGIRIAAAWAWRIAVVLLVVGVLVWLLRQVSFLIIPIMVAALLASLLSPVSAWLRRHRFPRGMAVAATVLGFIGLLAGSLALVGRQLAVGFGELWQEALAGIQQIQDWLRDGPLHLTADQIDRYISDATNAIQNNSSSILSGALSFGSTAGHFAAGLVLALFILIFFLLEGDRIWQFLVRLLPRNSRMAVDGAGRRGWTSMVSYVRIQMFVAFVDAVGIGVGAAIIGVPLALPLGVLVFIGSFIPVVGALVTGVIAVLLALVANGPINALVMLGIVLLVQQLESHILQPLIMGKAVSLHPVAVILTVAAGSYLAGIPGALFAVPLLAVANSAIRYIASRSWEHDQGLASAYYRQSAEAAESDEDPSIKETHLGHSGTARGGEATGASTAANQKLADGRAADTNKGE
ncbi:AI-2E family transporter [Arthrobacter sp. M4]|uniref:AI-2E family transporter n=1 Tax=Arthrobacter sp. M4 TaxID=218160 RepID=UPI001CDC3079|nr:AI-2E family transporter [Arthrobacter sp. M4]MCA4133545.1 AI-2E family transporter [Arthrobacter sp. M4]